MSYPDAIHFFSFVNDNLAVIQARFKTKTWQVYLAKVMSLLLSVLFLYCTRLTAIISVSVSLYSIQVNKNRVNCSILLSSRV